MSQPENRIGTDPGAK